jgi:cytochrome c peroxidase
LSQRTADGSAPAFSDYGLIALGVPRNPAIERNRDPAFHDLGACGPERTDKKNDASFCGLFRTPTLRNVALRKTFFHNGRFHDLREVVEFYVTRDITPERWYAKNADGHVDPYDDLPAEYAANINHDAPFEGQKPGAKPRLSAREIDEVVAFMHTLTDGFVSANPYRVERAKTMATAAAANPAVAGRH